MEIQVNLVPVVLAWMDLQALLGYQDPQAERVLKEISCLPLLVLLAHLDTLGLWDQLDLVGFLETLGFQVSFI